MGQKSTQTIRKEKSGSSKVQISLGDNAGIYADTNNPTTLTKTDKRKAEQ